MEKKKIVVDARMINASGIGRYLQTILPGIISHFKNTIVLGDRNLINKTLEIDANIISFDNPIYSLSEQIKYTQIIPECDLFFSPHYNTPLLPIKAKHRIVTIHDVFHLAFYNELSLPQKIYSKIVLNSALKKSDKIVTVSNFSKNEILRYTNIKYENKISVIYNGVNFNEEKIGKKIDDDIQSSYFLFVGNVKPHKNLKRTLEAYKLFLSRYRNLENIPKFIIVGKKEGFITGDNVTDFVEKDPALRETVQFTGWISDDKLKELYRNALALVFPSYYEGFGFPPLEAMAMNCAVIASDCACIPEICKEAALYFNPFEIISIMEKMEKIFINKNIRNDLIIKGKKRISEFSSKKTIQEHIELFEQYL